MIRSRLKHFYLNKYLVKPFSKNTYFLSYDYRHKALWFRVYKVSTRTIDHHLKEGSEKGEYIYSSEVGYLPSMFKDYFKFAFVRNPETRMISAWKDKVMRSNYFHFDANTHEKMRSFPKFVSWVSEMNVEKCDEHLRSQFSLIDVKHVDFIGRFENFREDFSYVTSQLGIKEQEFVRKNRTDGVNVEVKIESDVRRQIQKIYQKDYQQFYPDELIGSE